MDFVPFMNITNLFQQSALVHWQLLSWHILQGVLQRQHIDTNKVADSFIHTWIDLSLLVTTLQIHP
jgi:hypothetical protein